MTGWEECKRFDLHGGFPEHSLVKPKDFDIKELSVHMFSDASESGYGAVAYLRYVSNAGAVHP